MHFIRAFPIALIFVLMFCCCFAYGAEWIREGIPQVISDNPNSPTYFGSTSYYSTGSIVSYYASYNGTSYSLMFYSPYPFQLHLRNGYSITSKRTDIDGIIYYETHSPNLSTIPNNVPIVFATDAQDSLTFILSTNRTLQNNILYNITAFVRASNVWLTSIVQTVMSNPLLLIILLFYFVGTSIGLLFRFRRN